MDFFQKLLDVKVVKDGKNFSHICFPKFLINEEKLEEFKKKEFIEKIWEENNFININFNSKILEKEGFLKLFEKPQKKEISLLIEHTSNNPTGPIHIGRIRNTLIGDFICNGYEYLGYKVKRHFYVNDLGKQIALIYFAKKNNLREQINFENYNEREDFITLSYYLKINNLLKEKKISEEEIDNLLKNVEKNEELKRELRKIAEFALKGIKKTFERLNVKFDSFDFESDFLEDTKKYLKEIEKNFEIEKIEDGIVLKLKINNKEEQIFLTKKDGTTTYLLRDISYHKWKENKADYLINVLGEDHKREFLILKTILNKLGFKIPLEGVFYSFVILEGQKLSTRKGNIVLVDEFLDKGKDFIKGDDKQKEKLAITAFKVFFLKTSINKPIDFKWKNALLTEGETGIYLQYSLVRAKSILRKSNKKPLTLENLKNRKLKEEMDLLIKLSYFNYYLEQSVLKRNPSIFLDYLFDLTKIFNSFYNKTKIINSEREEELITILNLFIKKMEDAFKIINIPILEKIEF